MNKTSPLKQQQQLYAKRKWRSRHVTTQLNERYWAFNPGVLLRRIILHGEQCLALFPEAALHR